MRNRYASILFACMKGDNLTKDFIYLEWFLTSNWKVYEFKCQCMEESAEQRKILKVGIVCFHLQQNTSIF